MKTDVQQTSLIAWIEIQTSLGKRQKDVMTKLLQGEKSNMQLSKELNLPINSITGRVKELREKDLVYPSRKGPCLYTGRTVVYWKAK